GDLRRLLVATRLLRRFGGVLRLRRFVAGLLRAVLVLAGVGRRGVRGDLGEARGLLGPRGGLLREPGRLGGLRGLGRLFLGLAGLPAGGPALTLLRSAVLPGVLLLGVLLRRVLLLGGLLGLPRCGAPAPAEHGHGTTSSSDTSQRSPTRVRSIRYLSARVAPSLTLGLVTVPLRDTMTSAESSSMETTPASTLSTTDLACVLLSWSRSTLDWVLNLFFSLPVVPATMRSRSCWAVSWSSDMRLTPIWRAACAALARSSASFLPCQVRTPRTPVATTSATTSTPRTIVVIRGQPRLIGPTSLAQRSAHEPLPRSISQLTSTSAARHDVPLAVGPVDGTGRWIVSSEFHRVGRIRQVQVAVRELRARRGRRRLGLRARALAAARALGLGPAAVTGVGAALGEPGARGGARRDLGVG